MAAYSPLIRKDGKTVGLPDTDHILVPDNAQGKEVPNVDQVNEMVNQAANNLLQVYRTARDS